MAEQGSERIGLHNLKPAPGSRHPRKRVGRGEGSGVGKTSGRGHKGAGQRSGAKKKVDVVSALNDNLDQIVAIFDPYWDAFGGQGDFGAYLKGRGDEVSAEQAAQLARTAAINAVAAVADLTGGVDAIGRVVKVVVYVASVAGFADQPVVANGASDVLGEIFGEAGRHARSAVGVAALPKNSPVEVELIVQVHATPTIHPL